MVVLTEREQSFHSGHPGGLAGLDARYFIGG